MQKPRAAWKGTHRAAIPLAVPREPGWSLRGRARSSHRRASVGWDLRAKNTVQHHKARRKHGPRVCLAARSPGLQEPRDGEMYTQEEIRMSG